MTDRSRKAARLRILDTVNRHRLRMKPYTLKTIQQAVCVARRQKLVSPAALQQAGFNSKERR
jgi:hypothetical protein